MRYPESIRKRYLTPAELERLTKALDVFPSQCAKAAQKRRGPNVKPETVEKARRHGEAVANVVRLALLTGARLGEILSARWEQLDLEDLEKSTWTKPASTTKQKADHVVPLGVAAVTLLQSIREGADSSPWVFPAQSGDQHLNELKDEWHAIRTAAKIPQIRFHDLRHSYASILVSGGASLPMIGALLGHSSPVTTARYAHLFDDPLRQLADEVGHKVTGTKSADVVPLKGGAA